MPDKKEEEEKFEELLKPEIPEKESLDFKTLDEFKNISYHPFLINYEHRRLQPIPGMDIATSSRKFLKLSPDFYLSGTLASIQSNKVVAGTDSATQMVIYNIPLNMISRNYSGGASASGPKDWRDRGNIFRIIASGFYTTDDATATVSIACRVGAVTFHTITTTAATVTNAPWILDWVFSVTAIGSSGTVESSVRASTNNINKDAVATTAPALNTTTNREVDLRITWTSGSAGDSLTVNQAFLELLN